MTAAAPATRRINRGGGHSYTIDGQKADGVTWACREGVPSPALIKWAADATAGYAVDHWDELAELTLSQRLRKLERARYDTVREAARRGTDIHALAVQLAAGEHVDVPEHLTGHVDAYLAFAAEWELREHLVETTVASRRYWYAGTLDVIGDLADGHRWLLDWKSSLKGIYLENALQVAAYRHADYYVDQHGAELPLPAVDRAGCVWLRADGSYELVPVDAGETTFRAFLYALQVARVVRDGRDALLGEALRPPEGGSNGRPA